MPVTLHQHDETNLTSVCWGPKSPNKLRKIQIRDFLGKLRNMEQRQLILSGWNAGVMLLAAAAAAATLLPEHLNT